MFSVNLLRIGTGCGYTLTSVEFDRKMRHFLGVFSSPVRTFGFEFLDFTFCHFCVNHQNRRRDIPYHLPAGSQLAPMPGASIHPGMDSSEELSDPRHPSKATREAEPATSEQTNCAGVRETYYQPAVVSTHNRPSFICYGLSILEDVRYKLVRRQSGLLFSHFGP